MDKHLPYIKQCLTLYLYDELSFIVHMFFIRKKKIFKNIITFSPISPQVTDVGESRPQFPVQHYLESLPENSPLGTDSPTASSSLTVSGTSTQSPES